MHLDLETPPLAKPWLMPERYWAGMTAATADLDTPVAALNLDALRYNAHDMVRRADGKPIRIATKSLRVRSVIEELLELPGYAGVLAFTLAEALWLSDTVDDIVVGYPGAERHAIEQLSRSPQAAGNITLMIDSVDQLDFIDSVVPPKTRETIRVAIELDSSWDAPVLGHLGVWRSPIHTPEQAVSLALRIVSRPGFDLVGMMGYEAQVAGRGDDPNGRPLEGGLNRWMRKHSIAELADRRGAAVAAVRHVADLEFVNGGGTGSLESTSADASVTDIAAGSGFFGGHLFDNYSEFAPAPAAAFALSVVRKPTPEMVTLLGGGWIASGPPHADRMPQLVWPQGLSMVPREMAGEVQTPLTGAAAAALTVGDRVWLRHTKSGELSERVNEFALVQNDQLMGIVPTYRGEGKAFL